MKLIKAAFLIPSILFCLALSAEALLYAKVEPPSTKQGATFTVSVTSDAPVREMKAKFANTEVPFYPTGEAFRAIIGVSPKLDIGAYFLNIKATEESGKISSLEKIIRVRSGRFLAEKLTFLAPTKKTKLSSAKIQEDQDKIMEVLSKETPGQLWEGKFIRPIKGYITSPFGAYRLYNGKRLGDHRGMDIGGNPIGAPIKAANSGKIAFTQFLPTIGSTIVIDHGQGVNSIYMHMSKTLVKPGDEVQKGQVIGKIGNTGLSNGPHLHWGMSVHGVRVNPLEWATRTVAK